MPAAPKSKAANGSSAKAKTPSSTNGTTTPVSTAPSEKKATLDVTPAVGRPDKNAYDAEQQRIKSEIDALQVKLSAVRDKIGLASKSGSGNERRNALKAERDGIRDQQAGNKASRGKLLDQLKALNESVNKRVKELNAAKGKIPYKSVAELDAHVNNLEKQVESGSMKLAEEKRALQEISQTKRNRKTLEGFQADQEAIDADRKKADELRKQLDDPDFKATSDRYEAITKELDELKKEEDVAYAGRSKLFAERDELQAQINTLYNEKRDSAQKYREHNDRYWNKVNEDRARRLERARAQRAAEEAEKKREIAQRLREEAELPAFQAQIEDCQTLIDALSGKTTGEVTFKSTAAQSGKADIAGVPKLDIRKVEDAPEGMVARKKKGDDGDNYFVAKGRGGKNSKKNTPKSNDSPAAEPSASSQLNLPFSTLSALLSLSIPPPTSAADVPRVIEDVGTKKAWFEANQARVTAENIAKAEAEIQRLSNEAKEASKEDASGADVTPPNGGGERPGEPAPTPKVADTTSVPVPSEEVDAKLEAVQEDGEDSTSVKFRV
ncbi:multicopy suppressor of BFA (Brefeldin A) [Paramarasmius palmivorus]|uniref:Multicopy suppressor of BFA (Brefeldin A) n=1 Tax=Paramarasmius palmivorus TaxID=297713 RepID=A0AAW0DB71_9AGAR